MVKEELSKKLARTAGLFYKILHYAPIDTLTLLYHELFASFVTYGISVWGSPYPTILLSCFKKDIEDYYL